MAKLDLYKIRKVNEMAIEVGAASAAGSKDNVGVVWEECQADMGYWLPSSPGEVLEGVVQRVIQGQYGLQVEVKSDDGSVRTTPSHKVLQARLSGILVGDRVLIEFKSEELPKIKGQKGAKIYKVLKAKKGVM